MHIQKQCKNYKTTGFSLIELMIVMAIIGILAAIALPSYSRYVIQSKRVEGRAALMDTAAILERTYSDSNRYATADDTLPAAAQTTSETGLYNITIAVATPFQAYTLTAAPTFTDADCGSLNLQQNGTKGSTIAGTKCW